MASRRRTEPVVSTSKRPPATTPEARENQMIALAVDLAERQMREGTASAQVVTHFLKLGSSRERLEQERLAMETSLSGIKKEAIQSQARVEELYMQALSAMRQYGGQEPLELTDEPEY